MISVYAEKIGEVWFGVAYEEEIIYATNFGSNIEDVLRGICQSISRHAFTESPHKTEFLNQVIADLKNIYYGKEPSHSFALSSEQLPKYTWKILQTIRKVPAGYVTSYGEVAKAAGGGPRAVGQIMARNPFAPICPCHRVVRSDFTLGGYAGGLDVKLAFLKREKRGYSSEKEVTLNGRKLKVFPVELAIRKAAEG